MITKKYANRGSFKNYPVLRFSFKNKYGIIIYRGDKMTGVYIIINNITKQTYIGSSKDINRRFRQHKYNGKTNSTHNKNLYNDMYNYGIDNFSFELLEETSIDDMRLIEKKYMDKYNPYYNVQNYTENIMDIKKNIEKHKKVLESDEYKNKIKETRGFTKTNKFREEASKRSKNMWNNNYEKMCEQNRINQSSDEYREKRKIMALEPEMYKNNILSQRTRIGVDMFDLNNNKIRNFLSATQATNFVRENIYNKANLRTILKHIENNIPVYGYIFKREQS